MEKAFAFHKIVEDTFEARLRRGQHIHPRAEKSAELLFRQHIKMFFEKVDIVNNFCIEEDLKKQKEMDRQEEVQVERYLRQLSSTPVKKPKCELSSDSLGYNSFTNIDENILNRSFGKLELQSFSLEEEEDKSVLRKERSLDCFKALDNDHTYVEMSAGNPVASKMEEFHRGSYTPYIHFDDYEFISIDLSTNQSDGSNCPETKTSTNQCISADKKVIGLIIIGFLFLFCPIWTFFLLGIL